VKVRLEKGTENVAFDVSFARLNVASDLIGKDVTINWQDISFDNEGIFYSDSNGFSIVKHDINHKKVYDEEKSYSLYAVPSYFYPVTAGIYTGDSNSQMIVTNDRP